MTTDWPVDLRGVTETVVTTLGPKGRWNVAALGVHAPEGDGDSELGGGPATARTWGRTRTWRNFREEGEGYVQFTRDPVTFAEAALTVSEADDPVVDEADAWVRVDVTEVDSGEDGGTEWVEWELVPRESAVERESVPTIERGFAAVVEATVAASRLDVDAYDTERLLERLAYFEDVVDRCGGQRERAAFDVVRRQVDAEW